MQPGHPADHCKWTLQKTCSPNVSSWLLMFCSADLWQPCQILQQILWCSCSSWSCLPSVQEACGGLEVQYQGQQLDFAQPFRRATMTELVREATGGMQPVCNSQELDCSLGARLAGGWLAARTAAYHCCCHYWLSACRLSLVLHHALLPLLAALGSTMSDKHYCSHATACACI